MVTNKKPEKCLLCDNSTQLRRGLCSSHYQKFIRAWRSIPKENRAEFEMELIEEGLLLPAQTRGRKSEDMIFKEKAEKYMLAPDKNSRKSAGSSKSTKKSGTKKPSKKKS